MQATNKQTIKKKKRFHREWFHALCVRNKNTDEAKGGSSICFISIIIIIIIVIIITIIIIIIIINVFSASNCYLHSPITGAIPWP